MPQTLYDKIWEEHLVHEQKDGTSLLFVDRHLIHEVTSPQAFEGLRNSNRKVRQPNLTLAVADHNVPTTDRSQGIEDKESKLFKDFSVLLAFNFKKLHSVSDYAARLGISPKSLTKHFQKLGSKTPSDLIKSSILTEAKRQLLYSNEAVKNIAFDLGFNDPAYFSRFFTKATGVSPNQFKKSQKI